MTCKFKANMGSPMIHTIENLYKKPDIFHCVHDVHRHFKSDVSPYHVLKEKKCYPDGCIYFQWKCKQLAKLNKCFRNFTQTGRECFNCKYFFEEKIHQYPEINLNNEQATLFFEQFEQFEDRIGTLKHKRVPCEGTVNSIKPKIVLYKNHNRFTPALKGFLVRFNEGFIDNRHFIDPFFLSISAMTQNKLQIRNEDSIEFVANLHIDKGRFIFVKSGNFHFFNRGNGKPFRKSEALLALNNFTIQGGQPKKCLICEYGILADIVSDSPGPQRTVVCLQGVNDYNFCPYPVEHCKHEIIDKCIQIQTKSVSCHQPLESGYEPGKD
jgi:hypothetical protein